jgi:L-aspartate oxidase
MRTYFTDTLIIGSGIAGLYAAIEAHKYGRVLVVTKKDVRESSTEYAQGGIAAVVTPDDSPDLHFEDTVKAGAGLCNEEAVKILVTEGPQRIRDSIEIGVRFDTDHGHLALTREGAHSRRRILHAFGDATGHEIHRGLIEYVLDKLQLPVLQNVFVYRLISYNGRIVGVWAFDHQNKQQLAILAKVIILATGGIGQLYSRTTNPSVATADGQALAWHSGAQLMDMEFVQFHPTVLALKGVKPFLISEAVRGEGAILLNKRGQRFMPKYHPLAELAPRDVVARAIFNEMQRDGAQHVWLDISHKPADFVRRRFPGIYKFCLEHGIDITKDRIPVAPAAHYMMGGVRTDLVGRTTLPGLYAAGEVACNGVHGANRLASNSLLDGLVFGARIFLRAANEIRQFDETFLKNIPLKPLKEKQPRGDSRQIRQQLQRIMSDYVGIVRNKQGLTRALSLVKDLKTSFVPAVDNVFDLETDNMLEVATIIIRAALERQESRGSHYRSDFPQTNPDLDKTHIIFQKNISHGTKIRL